MSLNKDGGYRLPQEVDPQRIQFCIEIPNDLNHIIAFWGALEELTYWRNWERDEAHTALAVTSVWADVIKKARSSLDNADCESPVLCQEYRPTSSRLEWFPESPYAPGESVPDGYTYHPWTIVDNSILGTIIGMWGLGYQVGDVYTDFTKLPAMSSWEDIFANLGNMPSIKIDNLHGEGTVKLHLLNIPQGGRLLVQIDDSFDLLNYQAVELNKDLVSVPQETQTPIVIEVPVAGLGDHSVKISFLPTVDEALIPIFFGGGFRSFELCGFGREGCHFMSEECCDDLISGQSTTNELLAKIISMLQGGVTGTFQFNGNIAPPDEGAGDCAPSSFDHNGDSETGDELVRRNKALCLTVNQYVKALLLKVLRDMNSPQALIDYVDGKFPDVTVPLSLSNLTVIYPNPLFSLTIFFNALADDIAIGDVACAMFSGLTGDKNNTSSNFRDSLSGIDLGEELQDFVTIVHGSNAVSQNYKDFNTTLNANNNASVDDYECPCSDEEDAPLTLIDVGVPTLRDTVITYLGGNVWRVQQPDEDAGGGGVWSITLQDSLCRQINVLGFTGGGSTHWYNYGSDCTTLIDDGVGGFGGLTYLFGLTFSAPVDITVHIVLV